MTCTCDVVVVVVVEVGAVPPLLEVDVGPVDALPPVQTAGPGMV